jgi:hypothetical protein
MALRREMDKIGCSVRWQPQICPKGMPITSSYVQIKRLFPGT